MPSTLAELLDSYGYVLLALLVGLQGLGLPLPGQLALVTSAALAARGHLSITGVVVTTIVAAIGGDNGGYWIGRKGGLAVLQRYGRYLRIGDTHLARARGFFERHGAKAVVIARYWALLRTFAPVLAGAAQMRYRTFIAWNAAGVIVWTSTFATLGYVFGRHLPELLRYIGRATLAVGLVVALVVAVVFWWRWFEKHRERLAGAAVRFARAEHLGAHVTVAFVISLLGLWLAGGIMDDVIGHEPLTRLDMGILDWVQAHATPVGFQLAHAISLAGSPVVIVSITVAVTIALGLRRQWIYALGWVAALAGSGLLITVLELLVQRTRPAYAAAFLDDGRWSFPGGHAMGSLVCYAMLGYLVVALATGRTWTRLPVGIGVALLVIAIGASRVYLGEHAVSDVIGGYAAGVLWLAACVAGVAVAKGSGAETPEAGSRTGA